MAVKGSSKATKERYKAYQLDNRVYKNKVKKLIRHIKNHLNDEKGEENLARIKKDGYKGRTKPLIPGSNPTIPRVLYLNREDTGMPETVAEQLHRLLGVAIPKQSKSYRGKKPAIFHKKKRNVKTPKKVS